MWEGNKLWVLKVLALLCVLALCLWLIFRPKSPSYTILDLSLPPASNDTISYALEIQNPSTDSTIYFDDILLTFLYGDEIAGEDKIYGFRQKKGNIAVYKDCVIAHNIPRAWKALESNVKNATVELKVALTTRVRYKTLGVKGKRHIMKMQGRVKIGSDGKIGGKKKKIKLRHATKK